MLWIAIGSGMMLLLVAAIGKKNKQVCRNYSIVINGAKNNLFIDEKDVLYLVAAYSKGKIKGEPVTSFQLHKIEKLLEDNVWIKDAELYFDNQDVLHIQVTEREPVARIITTDNGSFYIDATLKIMTLSEKHSARVPLFTGFPEKNKWNKKDSLLMNNISTIAAYINNDPFWSAQVSQVDITSSQTFEMIPVVGNHVVQLGTAENIDKKFKKLFIFYKQVLTKTGFDKYGNINVQFAGQVVATPRGSSPVMIDSARLKNNVQLLLQKAQQAKEAAAKNSIIEKPISKNEVDYSVNENKMQSDTKKPDPDSVKAPKSVLKQDEIKAEQKQVPKAVMPRKEN